MAWGADGLCLCCWVRVNETRCRAGLMLLSCGDEMFGTEDTHRVALAEGLDVKEGEDLVALEELKRRDITYLFIPSVS